MDFIEQTKNWIREVVIGCNFCPFAAREVKLDRVRYRVEESAQPAIILTAFREECERLDKEPEIATTLLILPKAVGLFRDYLDLLGRAEKSLRQGGWTGKYQVASFHPQYRFAGVDPEDAANFTNRSIYPMLHILREADVTKAIAYHADAEGIPQRNVEFARDKGAAYMKALRDACL